MPVAFGKLVDETGSVLVLVTSNPAMNVGLIMVASPR
jgi:hypothetical protein